MHNLTELANKYKSDKGLTHAEGHGYTLLYQDLFSPFKGKKINFLEIGLRIGGPELGGSSGAYRGDSPSVKMWQKFFGNEANITGFDISDFSHQQDNNFDFIMGDSGSDEDMIKLSKFKSSYDIIIEDASHNSYHQQNAIKFLWDTLAPNGLFIVEDLHWQPRNDFNLPKQVKTADLFHEFFNENKYLKSDVLTLGMMRKIKIESSYVLIHKSCTSNGKCLIIKKR